MAHIILRPGEPGAVQLVINGVDYSMEAFRDFELVSVGDDPAYAEVGLRVTFAVSRLDLGGDEDVPVTDQLPIVAQRVHSMIEASA